MKATGIVRRIDDLGRVVIPKEIRRTLKIYEGSPLEIFTGEDGSVVFRKYSGMEGIAELAGTYAEVITSITGLPCCICDTEKIVAASGKKSLLGAEISKKVVDQMLSRKPLEGGAPLNICEGDESKTSHLRQIVSRGDIMGAIMIVENGKSFNSPEILRLTAELLSRHGE